MNHRDVDVTAPGDRVISAVRSASQSLSHKLVYGCLRVEECVLLRDSVRQSSHRMQHVEYRSASSCVADSRIEQPVRGRSARTAGHYGTTREAVRDAQTGGETVANGGCYGVVVGVDVGDSVAAAQRMNMPLHV